MTRHSGQSLGNMSLCENTDPPPDSDEPEASTLGRDDLKTSRNIYLFQVKTFSPGPSFVRGDAAIRERRGYCLYRPPDSARAILVHLPHLRSRRRLIENS